LVLFTTFFITMSEPVCRHGPGTIGGGQICGTHFPPSITLPCGHMQAPVTGSRTSGGTHSCFGGTHVRVTGSKTSGGAHSCHAGTHEPVFGSNTSGGWHEIAGVFMGTHSLPLSTVPGGHLHAP